MTDTPGKTIHDLALHEEMEIGPDKKVLRVGGGGIYELPGGNVFVPLSPEFKFTDKVRKKDAVEQSDSPGLSGKTLER